MGITLSGCGVDFLGDIGRRLLHSGVCCIDDIRGEAAGVPVSEGITFWSMELGGVVAYQRH